MFIIGGKLCSFTLPRGLLDHIVKVKAKETAGVQDNKGRVFEGATIHLQNFHGCPARAFFHCSGAVVQSCSLGGLKMRDEIGYVCVFFPFILDIKFVGRTSRGHTGGRSHRISRSPSFFGTCLNFSREKDLAIPFPRRP